MTSQWNAFMGDLANNRDLAAVFKKGGEDFDSLDEAATVQLSSHLGRTPRIVESMYIQHLERRLDDEIWLGIKHAAEDFCSMPGVKTWWPTRAGWYSKRFRDFIQPMIDEKKPQRMWARP